jgi:hypothetical protein
MKLKNVKALLRMIRGTIYWPPISIAKMTPRLIESILDGEVWYLGVKVSHILYEFWERYIPLSKDIEFALMLTQI